LPTHLTVQVIFVVNKAFVRENDGDDDDEGSPEEPPIAGGKNYVTPAGAKKLQEELIRLKNKERPEVVRVVEWAAGNGDRSENGDYLYGKKKLRDIDRRIRFLGRRLDTAVIVDPTQRGVNEEKVFFGATVTFVDEDGVEKTYSIVGVDEIDVSKGRISWLSPLGAALLKGSKGETVQFRSPKGVKEIEIVDVRYVAIE
jgi:transcription elongation factor GreB